MALDTVPWFVGGGAEHSPAVARMLAYAATNGATGVNATGDLRVTALPTPGTAVRIMPGGAVMVNRYPGGGQQSYTVRNPTATDVEIPSTGSSGGATRYLILRVDDPEFGGQTPANPRIGPYVRALTVSSITNLVYPFVALAKIVQPANTATITQAMITDLRDVANPRTQRDLFLGASTTVDLKSAALVQWPSFAPTVSIPEWATWVKIIAHVNGAQQMLAKTYGQLRIELGTLASGVTEYDINSGASSTDGARVPTIGAILSAKLPDGYPGSDRVLRTAAAKTTLPSDPGYLRADAKTHIEYDVWFQEVAG